MVAMVCLAATVLAGPSLGVESETMTQVLATESGIGFVLLAFMRGFGSSSDGGGAIALVIVAAMLASTAGCGAGHFDVLAPIGRGAQDLQISSEPVIRGLRRQAIEQAIRAVYEAGGDRATAELARTRTERSWQCPVNGHRTYGSAVSAFIAALWLAEKAGEEPADGDGDGVIELADFLPLALEVVNLYRAIANCANSLEPGQLPVPDFLDLFPASWEVPNV